MASEAPTQSYSTVNPTPGISNLAEWVIYGKTWLRPTSWYSESNPEITASCPTAKTTLIDSNSTRNSRLGLGRCSSRSQISIETCLVTKPKQPIFWWLVDSAEPHTQLRPNGCFRSQVGRYSPGPAAASPPHRWWTTMCFDASMKRDSADRWEGGWNDSFF